jgi:nucleotide-binding universal stress UspA family protein
MCPASSAGTATEIPAQSMASAAWRRISAGASCGLSLVGTAVDSAAIAEIGRTGVVHVVTAGQSDLRDTQATAIRSALAELPADERPVVVASVVLADPVTALVYAAARADLLVVGGHRRSTTAQAIARRLCIEPSPFSGPCPLTIIDGTIAC